MIQIKIYRTLIMHSKLFFPSQFT